MTTLPLVDHVVRSNANVSLGRIRIIGVQHILGTTHAMLQSLYTLGLKPENVSLIGKCYSTNPDVLAEMRKEGIDVSEESLTYCSHTSFDDSFDALVSRFLRERLTDMEKYDRIVVIDDGGHFIQAVASLDPIHPQVVCIEQTSSGIHNINSLNLKLPIISVATCKAKRIYEVPLITRVIMRTLLHRLSLQESQPTRCLVVGGGPIGSHISKMLEQCMPTAIYDCNPARSDIDAKDFHAYLTDSDLIVGCTGTTSIPSATHGILWPGTTLVSASSSDREFDAVHYRRQLPVNSHCHTDIVVGGIRLLNSGFPINFDGKRHCVSPSLIQLTRALLAGSILQATIMPGSATSGMIPLAGRLQTSIMRKYLNDINAAATRKDGLFVRLFRKLNKKQTSLPPNSSPPIREAIEGVSS